MRVKASGWTSTSASTNTTTSPRGPGGAGVAGAGGRQVGAARRPRSTSSGPSTAAAERGQAPRRGVAGRVGGRDDDGEGEHRADPSSCRPHLTRIRASATGSATTGGRRQSTAYDRPPLGAGLQPGPARRRPGGRPPCRRGRTRRRDARDRRRVGTCGERHVELPGQRRAGGVGQPGAVDGHRPQARTAAGPPGAVERRLEVVLEAGPVRPSSTTTSRARQAGPAEGTATRTSDRRHGDAPAAGGHGRRARRTTPDPGEHAQQGGGRQEEAAEGGVAEHDAHHHHERRPPSATRPSTNGLPLTAPARRRPAPRRPAPRRARSPSRPTRSTATSSRRGPVARGDLGGVGAVPRAARAPPVAAEPQQRHERRAATTTSAAAPRLAPPAATARTAPRNGHASGRSRAERACRAPAPGPCRPARWRSMAQSASAASTGAVWPSSTQAEEPGLAVGREHQQRRRRPTPATQPRQPGRQPVRRRPAASRPPVRGHAPATAPAPASPTATSSRR